MRLPAGAILIALAVLSTARAFAAEAQSTEDRDVLFQVSTIGALLEGVYDGPVTFGELHRHGDFGLGTFNRLDGEMIGFGGDFYQINAQGVANRVPDRWQTPFAVVTFFDGDRALAVDRIRTYEDLQQLIRELLPTPNICYAIKVTGQFDYVKARSVPAQQRPYLKLVEAIKNQSFFEFRNVRGTLAGLWLPEYMKGVNVAGYHLHFLTEDRTDGGHLLERRVREAVLEIDYTRSFHMVLPEQADFDNVDLRLDKEKELHKVEQ